MVNFGSGSLLSVGEFPQLENVFKMESRGPEKFVDAITWQPLDGPMVKKAPEMELRYFEDKKVWTRRLREEALRKTVNVRSL